MAILLSTGACAATSLPDGFVFLTDVDPTILESPRYSTKENFTGAPVAGYAQPRLVLTKEAAHALKKVQALVKKKRGISWLSMMPIVPKGPPNSFYNGVKGLTMKD